MGGRDPTLLQDTILLAGAEFRGNRQCSLEGEMLGQGACRAVQPRYGWGISYTNAGISVWINSAVSIGGCMGPKALLLPLFTLHLNSELLSHKPMHNHVAATDSCTSIVLALGWQAKWSNLRRLGPQGKRKVIKIIFYLAWSKSMLRKEQHLIPDYALQLAHLQQFVLLRLTENFLYIIKFKREKGSNYRYVYSLCRYLCGLFI